MVDVAAHPSASLVLAGDPFTDPELQALAGRGALTRLLPGVYAPTTADAPGPHARAAALWALAGPLLAAGWTAVGPTAAWILVGGPAPDRLHAAVPHYHRRPAGGTALPWALVEADVAAGPGGTAAAEQDVLTVGPVRVTTPGRTVEDLLVCGDPDQARRAALVIARYGQAGLTERLARPSRRPGIVQARRRLADLLAALEDPAGGHRAA